MQWAVLCCVVVTTLVPRVRAETLDALEAVLPPALLNNLDDLVRLASTACELVPVSALGGGGAARWEGAVVEVTRGRVRRLRAGAAHRHLSVRRGRALPLYVPGWWNTPTDAAARALLGALLPRHNTVLVLDTSRAFGAGYLAAAAALDSVAGALAALVENLARAGVPPARLHLIGFSLGAHAAGAAARLVRARTGARVGRITALDPARPCFARAERRLRASDARFVHVLHSSAGVLGVERPLGHVDVYLNGVSVRQPECRGRRAGLECDHNESWRAYAASAAAPLRARRCAAWPDLAAASCSGRHAHVGYHVDTTLRGMFLYKSPD